jgi:hypothetical protein
MSIEDVRTWKCDLCQRTVSCTDMPRGWAEWSLKSMYGLGVTHEKKFHGCRECNKADVNCYGQVLSADLPGVFRRAFEAWFPKQG